MVEYIVIPSLVRATIKDYVDLFNYSFEADKKLSVGYLRWLYELNPHGLVIGMDAYASGELVAHYAIIPRRYRLGSLIFEAALSVNTATHPKHQGKGLFTKLANATYELATQKGVQFVLGVANANSVSGFIRKLGFLNLGQIRLYLAYRSVSLSESDLSLDVSSDWLNWRLSNPSRQYRIEEHFDRTLSIRTKVNSLPFNIARVNSQVITGTSILSPYEKESSWIPALTPLFGTRAPLNLRIPLKLQPSPWHMIWKNLDSELTETLPQQLRFDGLAMDTF